MFACLAGKAGRWRCGWCVSRGCPTVPALGLVGDVLGVVGSTVPGRPGGERGNGTAGGQREGRKLQGSGWHRRSTFSSGRACSLVALWSTALSPDRRQPANPPTKPATPSCSPRPRRPTATPRGPASPTTKVRLPDRRQDHVPLLGRVSQALPPFSPFPSLGVGEHWRFGGFAAL